ncbi:MAG: hypothetical protein IPP74_13170 [Alphaproteobacteria bacterium]|nr:hypothetical protein [Alphaproteobacteria bacterium]
MIVKQYCGKKFALQTFDHFGYYETADCDIENGQCPTCKDKYIAELELELMKGEAYEL